MISKILVSGTLEVKLVDTLGNIKNILTVNNLVVDTGKSLIASRLFSNSTSPITHMAIGKGMTNTTSTSTSLSEEVSRVSVTSSVTDNRVTYQSTFPSGYPSQAVDIREAGLFNFSTLGIMISRAIFPVVTKSASDTLTITWKLTIN